MIRSIVSKKWQGLTLLLVAALSFQLSYLPVASAANGRQAAFDSYVERSAAESAMRFLREAESQGYKVTDVAGNPIRAEEFIENAGAEFIMTSPARDGDAGFAYRVRVRNTNGVSDVSLAVTRPGDSKVLARRSLSVDYREDAAVVRLRLAQTERSLDQQLRALAGEGHASLWQRAGRALQSIFGVPSAHAGALSTGVRVALGFAGVGVALLALSGVAEHYGVVGARTSRYVILAGLALAAVVYYFNFEIESSHSGPVPIGD